MKLSKKIVKGRYLIIVIALLLIIPSIMGIAKTRVNYDMLTYLPQDMETVIGQEELSREFKKGAFAFVVTEGMTDKQISKLREEIEQTGNVSDALWYTSLADLTIPKEALPDEIKDIFVKGDASIIAVFFDTNTSSDETLEAVEKIRELTKDHAYLSGLSAMVYDLKELCENEEPLYVIIAVILSLIVMMILLDNFMVPFLFLASIGLAILYNLGSNVFLGEISYITKALSAVLQLAVTMDYSIFLWHRFLEEKTYNNDSKEAMAVAIKETFLSVVGSSITTVAGFIALMFMSFTLGFDLGLVMAKGVVIGVICCVTILPAFILVSEKALLKFNHKKIINNTNKISKFLTKRFPLFLVIFVLLIPPALYGYTKCNSETYYNIAESLPKTMPFRVANDKLSDSFDILSTHMLLVDSNVSAKDTEDMLDEMKSVDGVKNILALETLVGSRIPSQVIPQDIKEILDSGKWKLVLITSEYEPASDEVNNQLSKLNTILKDTDSKGMLIGEASCMKDMLKTMDKDFKIVNAVSIALVFIIIAFVTGSAVLPILLIILIELAIFVNFAIAHYTGASLPFIAPICVSTIQLGACVDYAILMTTRYKNERISNKTKKESVIIALSTSIPSIVVSSIGLFAATFGVYVYCNVDMISSICLLLARGALISVVFVICFLPAFLMFFDKAICKTTNKMTHIYRNGKESKMKNIKKTLSIIMVILISVCLPNIKSDVSYASQADTQAKEETVYVIAGEDGKQSEIISSVWLTNPEKASTLSDESTLTDIEVTKGKAKIDSQSNGKIKWDTNKEDVYYQGKSNKDLPVSIKVSYQLDGEEKQLSEIKGKSGHIKIVYNFKNNLIKNRVAFAAVTGLVLPNNKFENITISNGKVVNEGEQTIVAGFALPGLEEILGINAISNTQLTFPNDITIEADVVDLELSTSMTYITTDVFSDLDSSISSLDDMDTKINELSTNFKKLSDGSTELHNGLSTVNNSVDRLVSGAESLSSGASQLSQGASALESGASNLSSGVSSLNSAMKSLSGNSQAINQSSAAVFNQLLATTRNTLNQLFVANGVSITVGELTIDNYATTLDTLKTQLQSVSATLAAAIDPAKKSLDDYNTYYQGVLAYTNGVDTIANSMSPLVDGASALSNGTSAVKNGMTDLANGSAELRNGMQTLSDGISKLAQGSKTLSDGMKRFDQEGISKIVNLVQGDFKSVADNYKSMINNTKKYQTYSGKNSNTEGKVSFIYKISSN